MQNDYIENDIGNDEIIQVLESFAGSDEIVQIYANACAADKFLAGKILAVSEEEVLIASLNSFGKYDGYIVRFFDEIFRIEYGTQYANKMKKLNRFETKQHEELDTDYESLFTAVLEFAQETNKVVTLELVNSEMDDVIGYVDTVTEQTVTIHQIDVCGASDGVSVLCIGDITYILCDREEENAYQLLHEATDE